MNDLTTNCSACGFENPAAMRFCGGCGRPLERTCTQCGLQSPWDSRFCGHCGASLTGSVNAPAPAVDASQSTIEAAAERRHLTVLFCDLVNAPSLAAELDPEVLHELVRTFQKVCGEVFQDYGGHVAQYLGDGLLVYFGYPQADEDDARRAVHAALDAVAAVAELDHRLEARVGIHTGLVVAGEMGAGKSREQLALGQTPNIAARLQGLAEAGTVLVTGDTHGLVHDFFSFHDLGPKTLKGLSSPIPVYRVLRTTGVVSRFEVAVAKGLTPLVGREMELRSLDQRFERVQHGHGQGVLIIGDAGIGKSRLLHRFRQDLASQDHTWLGLRCSPFHRNTTFFPVAELLRRALSMGSQDSPEELRSKLERGLAFFGFSGTEQGELLAQLLFVPPGERVESGSSRRQREHTLELLLSSLMQLAAAKPVVVCLEDLQWADPSTLELLGHLMSQVKGAPLLVLLSARPGIVVQWELRSQLDLLPLGHLNKMEVGAMVQTICKGKALPPQLLRQLVTKTDGVPLFVEELTKTVLGSGLLREGEGRFELAGTLPTVEIPATLQDSLMARLDRLSGVKEVAQLAAVLGREFSLRLIQAVSPLAENTMEEALQVLVKEDVLYRGGFPPNATYSFKHALIQNAAYDSLLKSTRQRYHSRIARVLSDQFSEVIDTQPEVLAQHYTDSGEIESAIPYWLKAGRQALGRSANTEASGHLKRGLALLESVPPSAARDRSELELHAALGSALIAANGYGDPEVARVFSRSRELCEQLGDSLQLFRALSGLWMFYVVTGDYSHALELAERLVHLGEVATDPTLPAQAHYCVGFTRFYLGEFVLSRKHLDQAFDLYDPDHDYSAVSPTGDDVGIRILSNLALCLWHLGYPQQALERCEEATTVARQSGHPYGLAFGQMQAANLHLFLGDGEAVRVCAEEAITIAEDKGYSFFLPQCRIPLALATLSQAAFESEPPAAGPPESEASEASPRESIEAYLAPGNRLVGETYFLSHLGEIYVRQGRIDEATSLLERARIAIAETGERGWEAEIYRLEGEILLHTAGGARRQHLLREAERILKQALLITRQQEARSLELRAATSLARLWRAQGNPHEAHKLLAKVYASFDEGRDTGDLKRARALLDDLSQRHQPVSQP